jgi:3'-5' exonuclease
MLNQKQLDRVVFIDIETTSQYESFSVMPIRMQELFKEKFKKEINEFNANVPPQPSDQPQVVAIDEIYNSKAPLFAEWNKIICISMGVLDISKPDQYTLRTKSFCGTDEKAILTEFSKAKAVADYVKSSAADRFAFCAHNGKIFDFPVIAKRMIYNGLDLPFIFDYTHLKPWEVDYFIDTKDVWKYGVFDGNVSLDLLAGCFGVESSKMLMKGSDVKDVYYVTKDLAAIQKYCEHDIFTLASIYLKMKNIQIPLVK